MYLIHVRIRTSNTRNGDGSHGPEPKKNEDHTHIGSVSLDGCEDKPLTDGLKDSSPAWSPDGTQLAFLRLESGGKGLWAIASDDQTAVNRISPERKLSQFVWSPDG